MDDYAEAARGGSSQSGAALRVLLSCSDGAAWVSSRFVVTISFDSMGMVATLSDCDGGSLVIGFQFYPRNAPRERLIDAKNSFRLHSALIVEGRVVPADDTIRLMRNLFRPTT